MTLPSLSSITLQVGLNEGPCSVACFQVLWLTQTLGTVSYTAAGTAVNTAEILALQFRAHDTAFSYKTAVFLPATRVDRSSGASTSL